MATSDLTPPSARNHSTALTVPSLTVMEEEGALPSMGEGKEDTVTEPRAEANAAGDRTASITQARRREMIRFIGRLLLCAPAGSFRETSGPAGENSVMIQYTINPPFLHPLF